MTSPETITSIVSTSKRLGQTEEWQAWMDRLIDEVKNNDDMAVQNFIARLCQWATKRAKEAGQNG
jgi:hypothetical protein